MTESTRKFSFYRLIGLTGVFGIIGWIICMGGNPFTFIHLPSIFIVLGVSFFALLATFREDFFRFIPDALISLFSCNIESNPKFTQITLFASRYIIGSALIGMLIGMVQMLNNLSSPDDIGSGMAIVLLTLFYSVVISEILCAVLYQSYSDGDQTLSKPLPAKNIALPAITTLIIVISFLVLLVSFV